ncbi:ribose-5-phosphate isomerase [Pilibacter termitis]|uniref:Ribose-5-phosphate isomerase A n=1 Tax=Pilibacter termitis TaxID=263852 RepID=A0A1T4PMA4_9ENTE|nr:ribose-5-phosphate isomerase RpiA [Pilibacter termitis]SJZ92396.1 ribose-5-phosphate isomerase [Pilibacter termitis]
MNQEELKKKVGIESAKYIKDGMIVGLGTGSTARHMIEEVARRVREENLNIVGVTTSNETTKLAKSLGIPLKEIDEVPFVDVVIDGADEISADFQGIKGGGAALLFEKIVASYAKRVIWIVDKSKMVNYLGEFPLPVEVVKYGSENLFRLFEDKGYNPTFRMNKNEKLTTDGGHYIIDLHLGKIKEPLALSDELSKTVGVVEHGLFTNMVNVVIVGKEEVVETLVAR